MKGVEGKHVLATSPSLPTLGAEYPPEAPEGTETKEGQGSRPGATAETRAQTGGPASASTVSSGHWLHRAHRDW